MADIKLVYKLKQQSPMIHFQYDEDGVCLRASEVKPKLDRFLTDRLRAEKQKDASWKPWDVENYRSWYSPSKKKKDTDQAPSENDKSERDPSLLYKLKIMADPNDVPEKSNETGVKAQLNQTTDKKEKRLINEEAKKSGKLIPGAYFGNQKDNFKETVFYRRSITLEIICFNGNLRDHIDRYIDLFFLCTNFGTRQNKGYGSFVIEGKEDPARLGELGKKIWVITDEEADGKDGGRQALEDIKIIYAVMKSGYNVCIRDRSTGKIILHDYLKGFLFQYFMDPKTSPEQKEIHSDKAFVKGKIICKNFDSSKIYRYVRGLLGINDGVNYRSYGKGKEGYPTVTENVKMDSLEDGKIERFPSPVTFKIIGNSIYIIPEEIPDEIRGAWFCFSSKYDTQKKEDRCLTIPEIFDLDDFLEKFADAFNKKSEHVWGKSRETGEKIYMSDLESRDLKRIKTLKIVEMDGKAGEKK